jgi:adenylosuccinate lyase
MLNRLAKDSRLGLSREQLSRVLADTRRFVGAAPQQVDEVCQNGCGCCQVGEGSRKLSTGQIDLMGIFLTGRPEILVTSEPGKFGFAS